MRIISGKYKGRRITAPNNLPVRPTTDMAKESLFNILNNQFYFDQLSVLDLFSGIGSISLEFASRGCNQVTAVDQHRACIKFLERTNQELAFNIQTIQSDAFQFLSKVNQSFDVIFADPPYDIDASLLEKLANSVFERNLLNSDGVLVIEHSKFSDLSQHAHFTQSRKYGGNMFSFFENIEN